MRDVTKVVIRCLAAAFLLMFAGSVAHSQVGVPIDTTHYWTWTVGPRIPNQTPGPVQVRDQFLPGVPIQVDTLSRLLNPVFKFHEGRVHGVRNPELHYTWWDVRPPYRPNQTVVYYDQFYPQGAVVNVDTLAFLLTPASKRLQQPVPPPPQGENHYLCYRIFGPSPNVPVGLQDQFRTGTVDVQRAEYLCAPCEKQHGPVIYPPRDSTHLIFYWVQNPHPVRDVFLNDQFLVNFTPPVPVFQTPFEYLVVPARKTHISTPTKRSTWGRMKSLHR
jgi:hypothetical protein